MQDLYDMLGVPRNADLETIKYAFRRKARRMHPDCGGNPTDFQILVLARRVLSDQHLREQYDRTGRADLDSVDTRHQQALTIIQNLLTAAMNKIMRIDVIDLVEVMRTDLLVALQNGNAHITTHNQTINRLEQVRDRITVKGGLSNRLAALLDGQIRLEQAAIERCQEQLRVHEIAKDILKDYGYKTDHMSVFTNSRVPF